MCRNLRKRGLVLLVIIFVLIPFFVPGLVFSFSLNSLNFFQKTAKIVVNRTSDIIYYLLTQKKYIFDDFSDPNIYPEFKNSLPVKIEEIILSSRLTDITKPQSKNIVTVTTSTLPNLDKTISQLPAKIIGQIIPPVPAIISKQEIEIDESDDNLNHGAQILKFTNFERARVSLPVLSSSSILNQVASVRADDLFTNQYFDHNSPTGKSASEVAKQFSYDYLLIGENLALGSFDGDQGIVSAWMDSPGHKKNILNSRFTELGVAYKTGVYQGIDTVIAVQIFGLPLTQCLKPNQKTKDLADNSIVTISQMQKEAQIMFVNLTTIRNNPELDLSYYDQKIQEYNYMVRKINEAVAIMQNLINSYNIEVRNYNDCINNLINL